jgi:deoxycytidylate deaminase
LSNAITSGKMSLDNVHGENMRYLEGVEFEAAKVFMLFAADQAYKALCLRAKCGAVVVKENLIIGRGYNAPPLDDISRRRCLVEYDLPQKFKYDRTCCVHAEWRAIRDASRRHPDIIEGSTLYFTRVDDKALIKKSGKPYCTECSRMALDEGISFFVLWHDDGIAEYSTLEYNDLSYAYTEP